MSRDLADLDPRCRVLVDPFLADAKAQGIDVLVTCTLRSIGEQALLYAQGRTLPGKIVTNARPGSSAHNYGLAVDIVPIVAGKPDWSGEGPVWEQLGSLGAARGLEWAGAPDFPFHEEAHFQVPNWRVLAEPEAPAPG